MLREYAVAWIGNQPVRFVEHASRNAAKLLDPAAARFSLSMPMCMVHAAPSRWLNGQAAPTTMLIGRGARATKSHCSPIAAACRTRQANAPPVDVLWSLSGEIPSVRSRFAAGTGRCNPILAPGKTELFHSIGTDGLSRRLVHLHGNRAVPCAETACRVAALAVLRAELARSPYRIADQQPFALRNARNGRAFPVFLFSGHGADMLALEMLQGLVGDLNRKSRASALHLPADESGWGSALASHLDDRFPAAYQLRARRAGIRSLAFRRCPHAGGG